MVNATALITNNNGNNDFIKGEAVKLALEIPNNRGDWTYANCGASTTFTNGKK